MAADLYRVNQDMECLAGGDYDDARHDDGDVDTPNIPQVHTLDPPSSSSGGVDHAPCEVGHAPLALTDLAPELHCHIVRLCDARSAVAYVGASRAARVLNHAQALALRPTVGIGECLCGCDMHICDRCSCGSRGDRIDSTIRMGCTTLCYPVHVTALLKAGRVDEARILCRRVMDLVLPAFAHLGDAGSHEAFASWILYDALLYPDDDYDVSAAAVLAHEMAGTCVFCQNIWESPALSGVDGAILRGHYECIDRCINSANCAPHARRDAFADLTARSIVESATGNDDGIVDLDRLAARCKGAVRYRPDVLRSVGSMAATFERRGILLGDDARAVIAQFVPGLSMPTLARSTPVITDAEKQRVWSRRQSKALREAFEAGRMDEFDVLCVEARRVLGDGDNFCAADIVWTASYASGSYLHRDILYTDDPANAVRVLKSLSTHFPRAWDAKMRKKLVRPCSRDECTPCTSVMHVACVPYAGNVMRLKGSHLCFALWPTARERGWRVRNSRARALALLACESVRWPRRVALTAAAYGDVEVLDVLDPRRFDTEAPGRFCGRRLVGPCAAGPPAWTAEAVALLFDAGYGETARDMASRYGVDYTTLDVALTVNALDAAKPHRPWSSLYSRVVPQCPCPLAILSSLQRHDARAVLVDAVSRGVGIPMHPLNCVHLAARFPGVFDGQSASQVVKPTLVVGAIDWLCGQTDLRFDSTYVLLCASIGATATVYRLVVRYNIACDVDAVRAALPAWVANPFEGHGTGEDNEEDSGGGALPFVPWMDAVEPALRAVSSNLTAETHA